MKRLIYIFILWSSAFTAFSQQDTLKLTLQQAIDMAKQYSPDAIGARHSFRSSYWNYKSYRANLLPSLVFNANPSLTRAVNKITQPDGSVLFRKQNQLNTSASFSINQNIPFTGGQFFVNTEIQRLDNFADKSIFYQTSPVTIGYQQDLLGYNSLKWDKKIEPLKYEIAKKSYVETMEGVAANTVRKFFNLATAQSNMETACFNYANADTLYRYAEGRYNIGTITENEMLQLEINKLTEETNMMNARIDVDDCIQDLRSYLGIKDHTELKVEVEESVPKFQVEVQDALAKAMINNPEMEIQKRRRLESESSVAYAKSQTGFKANLYLQFGLTQTSNEIREAYKSPLDQQQASLGIRVPILDWGVGKGRVKVAKSNRDKVYTEVEQEQNNFELNVLRIVKQFNLQAEKVNIAAKTDQTAQRRNDVARRLYLLGKSTILDMNASISEKDSARRSYINSLYNFWNLFYALRTFTLYDYEQHIPITEDYKLLLK